MNNFLLYEGIASSPRNDMLVGFSSCKNSQFVDAEITIDLFVPDLAQPVTLRGHGQENIGILVRAVHEDIRDLLAGLRAATFLLNGITRIDDVLVEQVDGQLRFGRDVLDVDEPSAGLEQGM